MKEAVYLFTYLFIMITNPTTMKNDISQIDFNAGGCEGTCPIFTMTILNDGTANYNAILFNEQKGKFKTIIKKNNLIP